MMKEYDDDDCGGGDQRRFGLDLVIDFIHF
jgi:hypothetical protein